MAQLLLLYEIADRAAKVTTKKALQEFEQWLKGILEKYQDAAIRQVARRHLFMLRERLGLKTFDLVL